VHTNDLTADFAILTDDIKIEPCKDEGMVPMQWVRVCWRILSALPGAEAAKKTVDIMWTLQ
jgi:hypothetical protein